MQRRHHMTMYGLNFSGYVFDAYSVTFIWGDHLYGKPGNVGDFELTAVTEMSGILLQVREVTWKKSCQGKEVMNKIGGVNLITCLFLK